MDALDQLLVACHAHSLNLFVESFLKMVQKLLECEEPELQILATQSVSVNNTQSVSVIIIPLLIFPYIKETLENKPTSFESAYLPPSMTSVYLLNFEFSSVGGA
jgi:hypothetical protein